MIDQVLQIAVVNKGPGELKRVRYNTLVPLPHQMRPSDHFGNVIESSGSSAKRLPDTSESLIDGSQSGCWAERLGDIDEDAMLCHFRLTFTEPGVWPVRVRLSSPSFYRRRDIVQDVDVVARAHESS
jgi:hypothetical protein